MKNLKVKIIALAALVGSSSAFAEDNAITTAINAAITTGQANYGLVVVGLIGLAALGFGLRQITGGMRG